MPIPNNSFNLQTHKHSTAVLNTHHDSMATRTSNVNATRCLRLCPKHKRQTLHRARRMELSLLSRSPVVLRAMDLRFIAILFIQLVCVRFYDSLDSRQSFSLRSCHFFLLFLLRLRCFYAISPFFFVRESVIVR